MLWRPNDSTRIVIPVNFDLVDIYRSPMRKQAYTSYRMMFSMMARLGTFVCKYVSDFALFSRLFLISELKCCNCV